MDDYGHLATQNTLLAVKEYKRLPWRIGYLVSKFRRFNHQQEQFNEEKDVLFYQDTTVLEKSKR